MERAHGRSAALRLLSKIVAPILALAGAAEVVATAVTSLCRVAKVTVRGVGVSRYEWSAVANAHARKVE
ncbi:MAG TPA: hypothetical protein VMI09_04995 [Candidatus Binataceae bacterium]|nr:hypothetical protein [Candidatus Binataceae bacterium]